MSYISPTNTNSADKVVTGKLTPTNQFINFTIEPGDYLYITVRGTSGPYISINLLLASSRDDLDVYWDTELTIPDNDGHFYDNKVIRFNYQHKMRFGSELINSTDFPLLDVDVYITYGKSGSITTRYYEELKLVV